jgi:hypothetical protein
MANFSWESFWTDVGMNALRSVCFPVYGTIDTIAKGAWGDWKGAFESGAETLCPISIGAGAGAIERLANGDYAGAAQKGLEILSPSSVVPSDPFSKAFDAAISNLGKQGIQAIIDGNNKNQQQLGNPALQPKEDPKEDVKEEEQKIVEKDEARDITNQQANTARKAAYQAAINSGATPAQAQAAADAQTPIGNFAGNYAALAGAGANARANYRERQGYADALGRETLNLAEARNREILAAALQGAGIGAQGGASIFPSNGNSVGGGN